MIQPEIAGYTDLEPIGAGGFGVVYRATQERFGRAVAIKVLPVNALDSRALTRFERECRASTAVNHPNVVTVHDGGVTDLGQAYLVMELLEGGSLDDLITHDGPLDWKRAAHLGAQVAGALQAVHDAGVLHRDIKPENVLLDSAGRPKLADFGISQDLDLSRSKASRNSFTPMHAAPEVIDSGTTTVAADVYSLGSLLFTAVTGRGAFESREEGSIYALYMRIASAPVPDLRLEGIPDSLARIIERAMAKDPADRFPSAEALAGDLSDLVAAGPTPSRLVGPLLAAQADVPTEPVATVDPAVTWTPIDPEATVTPGQGVASGTPVPVISDPSDAGSAESFPPLLPLPESVADDGASTVRHRRRRAAATSSRRRVTAVGLAVAVLVSAVAVVVVTRRTEGGREADLAATFGQRDDTPEGSTAGPDPTTAPDVTVGPGDTAATPPPLPPTSDVTPPRPPPPSTPCTDGSDNDGDTLIDVADPDCRNGGRREVDDDRPPPADDCADRIDNDRDGPIDGEDPDCRPGGSGNEVIDNRPPPPGPCVDGEDNDGDRLVDGEDPDCRAGGPGREVNDDTPAAPPTDDYNSLLQRIPEAIRGTCQRVDDGADHPGELADARCRLGDGSTVWYQRYSTENQARVAWNAADDGVAYGGEGTEWGCSDSADNRDDKFFYEGNYNRGGSPVGSLRCYIKLSTDTAKMQWTVDSERIYAFAQRANGDWPSLLAEWHRAGPTAG